MLKSLNAKRTIYNIMYKISVYFMYQVYRMCVGVCVCIYYVCLTDCILVYYGMVKGTGVTRK